ncbi:unnamed protein product, partial [Mesorhabditis spiculigera]
MVYERNAVHLAEDPEALAEREWNQKNVSSASSLKKNNSFKEAKADRKKRSRGISGSTSKKDGGRFEHGFDSYDDDDLFSEDELEDLKNMKLKDYSSCEDEPASDVERDIAALTRAFHDIIASGEPGSVDVAVKLFVDQEMDLHILHCAVCELVEEDIKETPLLATITKNSSAEYHISVMLAVFLSRLYPDAKANVKDHRRQLVKKELIRGNTSAFVNMLFENALDFIEYETDELQGTTQGCPDEAVDAIVSAMTGDWFDRDFYFEQCKPLEQFHVEVIKKAIVAAIESMEMPVIHRVEKSILAFASFAGESFDCTYRLALARIVANSGELGGTPAWPNVLRVIVAGITESEQLWAYYSGPGRNWKLIPKSTCTIALEPNDDHLKVLDEVPKNNIQLIKQL